MARRRVFVPLSPRVGVLVAAAIVVGIMLWMARDSVRPFIVGLLFVYLLDIPVRWLVRRRVPRTIAILIVYVLTGFAIIEFLALTMAPLIDEVVRFVDDLPRTADQLNTRSIELSRIYARLEIPTGIRAWLDELIAGISQGGPVGGIDLSFLLPVVTGAGSLDRDDLRLPHPAGLGGLPAQGSRRPRRLVRPLAAAVLAVRHAGRSCGPSSGSSANGSAAS